MGVVHQHVVVCNVHTGLHHHGDVFESKRGLPLGAQVLHHNSDSKLLSLQASKRDLHEKQIQSGAS